MDRLKVGDAEIEYLVQGDGEPALLIHMGLLAEGLFRPIQAQPELASRFQLIHYHRRGYMGSTPGSGPVTISRQANDAAELQMHLGVNTAHVVGHSIAGLIALQLAIEMPGLAHSLALLEPSLPMVQSGKASFGALVLPMVNANHSGNKWQAVEFFNDNAFGPNWQSVIEEAIPGGIEQAKRDADAFIKELPSIQEWRFSSTEAAVIHQPVLSVLGVDSSQLMKEGRVLLHSWFPQTEDFDVPTRHLLQIQDPKDVAHGLAEFFARHPI